MGKATGCALVLGSFSKVGKMIWVIIRKGRGLHAGTFTPIPQLSNFAALILNGHRCADTAQHHGLHTSGCNSGTCKGLSLETFTRRG